MFFFPPFGDSIVISFEFFKTFLRSHFSLLRALILDERVDVSGNEKGERNGRENTFGYIFHDEKMIDE